MKADKKQELIEAAKEIRLGALEGVHAAKFL